MDSKLPYKTSPITTTPLVEELFAKSSISSWSIDGSGVAEGAGVDSGVGVAEGTGVDSGVGVAEGIGVDSGVGVAEGIGVDSGVGVAEGIGVDSGVGVGPSEVVVSGEGVGVGTGIVSIKSSIGLPEIFNSLNGVAIDGLPPLKFASLESPPRLGAPHDTTLPSFLMATNAFSLP